jgi:NADH:ubiquinone oxidoreductase subunit F (NADH-binding)
MLAVGTSSSQGTGHFQQSGHFQQPGLWELEDMCRTLLLAGCVRWK